MALRVWPEMSRIDDPITEPEFRAWVREQLAVFEPALCCAAPEWQSLVQYGSYFSRCVACGREGPATSWIGIARSIDGTLTAVTLDASGAPAETIAEGPGAAIMERVLRAAADGTLVRLHVQR